MTTWQQCGKKYQLDKIQHAPAVPAWWFAGGTAVHACTEEYDRLTLGGDPAAFNLQAEWAKAWDREVARLDAREPDRSKWRRSKEGYDEWQRVGPGMVQAWIDWRTRCEYKIWISPDGEPGIELDISGELPGCPTPLKGFVDRVFHDPLLDQTIIIDLKTGARDPESSLQFGVYAAALQARYGIQAAWGGAFMNRRGGVSRPYRLDMYTPAYMGRMFAALDRGVTAQAFLPKISPLCHYCDVNAACYAYGGREAQNYDPDHPDNIPPF